MLKICNCLAIFIFICCLYGSQSAEAQYLRVERAEMEDPVNERIPADLRPKKLAFSGFLYVPKVDVESFYDTNVLAQSSNEQSDFGLKIKPSLVFEKQYQNHVFKFGGAAEITRYKDITDENTIEPDVFFRGLLNKDGSLSLPFHIKYSQNAIDRRTPQNSNLSLKPIMIDTLDAEIGFMKTFNRLSLGFMTSYQNKSFSNGRDAVSNALIVNDDVDRTELRGTFKARYEFPGESKNLPRHILYADLYSALQDYKRLGFENGSYSGNSGDRNIAGFLAGIESNYKGLAFVNLGGGYERHSFKESNFDDIDIVKIRADLIYNILPKLTLKFGAASEISQDNGFIQGVKQYRGNFGADYELQHDLYAGTHFDYTNYKFIENPRGTEEDYVVGFNIRKLHSEHLTSKASIVYQDHIADDPRQDFNRMIFLLGATYQF